MAVDKQSLSRQLNADPRVRQYVASRRGARGAAEIPADLLRSWGFQLPDGYGVAVQGGGAQVYDKFDKWDVIVPAAGGAVLGAGALGAAGVGPLAGGGGDALASAGAVGSAPAYVPESMVGMGLPGGAAVSGADYLGTKTIKKVADTASQAPSLIQAALRALSGIPALVAANKNKPTAEELAMQQQIKDMLASQQRRTDYQSPLFEAVTRLAMNRLPTDTQRPLAERM